MSYLKKMFLKRLKAVLNFDIFEFSQRTINSFVVVIKYRNLHKIWRLLLMENYSIAECAKGDSDFVIGKLVEFNLSQVPPLQEFNFMDVSRKIVNKDGKLLAGIIGKLNAWNCLHIDMLWVDMNHRKEGLGSKILTEVERISKELGCYLVQLDTFDFQAKDFYLKHGYEIFGVLEDCPKDHKRYFLKKLL